MYLASFPRSGNHWVRFLVEEATHITTSSIYHDKDFPHLKSIFPWGGYCTDHGYQGGCRYPSKDDPVLLKTHYPYLKKMIDLNSQPAICLIRHPVDVFWSFYVYTQNLYGKKISKIKKKQLRSFIEQWRNFYEFWEKQPQVLFVRYEDLHENTAWYLCRILEVAGFAFSQSDIERAITKYPPQGAPMKHSIFYDKKAMQIIKNELFDILEKFNYKV